MKRNQKLFELFELAIAMKVDVSDKFFEVVFKGASLSKNVNRAFQLLSQMKQLGLKASPEVHYNYLIEACFKSGKLDRVFEALTSLNESLNG